ncbi:MAG: PIN domain-containing protein [Bifidobacteriaceae bacterium]|nr:PIN domain-containing protein [Bifidobacteriaceae bacterium]
MKLIDTNVLVCAVNQDALQHQVAKGWLVAALNGSEPLLVPWMNLIGFVRIVTHPKLLPRPLTADRALELVDLWLDAPPVRVVTPAPDHARHLRTLLTAAGRAGSLTNGAHLAALALANRAQIVTFDTDFALFNQVEWGTPSMPE